MLENPSDDDDDIETGYVIKTRQEPLYHIDEEEWNEEEICEQKVNYVPGPIELHAVKKSRSGSRFQSSERKKIFKENENFLLQAYMT